MKRALHPGLTKTGVVIDASGGRVTEPMTAGDMIGWTGDGEGVASRPADFAYDVTVDDVYHQIATVTVHSTIYREYLHLVKTPAGWKILNALYTRVLADRTDASAAAPADGLAGQVPTTPADGEDRTA
jgi:hypothetical protein